jgi:hypothetical protein
MGNLDVAIVDTFTDVVPFGVDMLCVRVESWVFG